MNYFWILSRQHIWTFCSIPRDKFKRVSMQLNQKEQELQMLEQEYEELKEFGRYPTWNIKPKLEHPKISSKMELFDY